MFYEPFRVDAARYIARFGRSATPLDRAVRATLDAYRAADEILLLVGNSCSGAGIFNAKRRVIQSCDFGLKVEQYRSNAPCLVSNKVYFLGCDYGHVVIYDLSEKQVTFCTSESTKC